MRVRLSVKFIIAACWGSSALWISPLSSAKSPADTDKVADATGKSNNGELNQETVRGVFHSASPAEKKRVDLFLGLQLHQLMYPGLEDLGRAVKLFQKDLGAEPTGNLTETQVKELVQRAARVNIPDIHFPTNFHSTDARNLKFGWATVQGTMVIVDDQIADPINTVTIKCRRSEKSCEFRATYLSARPENGGGVTWSFHEYFTNFDILSWTDDSIEAKEPDPLNERAREQSLSLNFKTQEFFLITKNSGNDVKNMLTGEKIEPLKNPRITKLIDGNQIKRDYFSRLKNESRTFFSSDFNKMLDDVMKEK